MDSFLICFSASYHYSHTLFKLFFFEWTSCPDFISSIGSTIARLTPRTSRRFDSPDNDDSPRGRAASVKIRQVRQWPRARRYSADDILAPGLRGETSSPSRGPQSSTTNDVEQESRQPRGSEPSGCSRSCVLVPGRSVHSPIHWHSQTNLVDRHSPNRSY